MSLAAQPRSTASQILAVPHGDLRQEIHHTLYGALQRRNAVSTAMALALARASRLKPEIRLAQAVSEFEASLTDEEKAAFRTYRSQTRDSPPNVNDVMRLTAEVDRRASRKTSRCFGPRLTNLLQAVQQFAALGDIVVGGSQNLIACGVWSLVRMTLLVGQSALRSYLVADFISTGSFSVGVRSGKVVAAVHGCRTVCSTLSGHGAAVCPLQAVAGRSVRILHRCRPSVPSDGGLYPQVHPGTDYLLHAQ